MAIHDCIHVYWFWKIEIAHHHQSLQNLNSSKLQFYYWSVSWLLCNILTFCICMLQDCMKSLYMYMCVEQRLSTKILYTLRTTHTVTSTSLISSHSCCSSIDAGWHTGPWQSPSVYHCRVDTGHTVVYQLSYRGFR